jgi:hypothetical protein
VARASSPQQFASGSFGVLGGAAAPLPYGWQQMVDVNTGRTFFVNHMTKKTQLEPPTATQPPPPAGAPPRLSGNLPPPHAVRVDPQAIYYANQRPA